MYFCIVFFMVLDLRLSKDWVVEMTTFLFLFKFYSILSVSDPAKQMHSPRYQTYENNPPNGRIVFGFLLTHKVIPEIFRIFAVCIIRSLPSGTIQLFKGK